MRHDTIEGKDFGKSKGHQVKIQMCDCMLIQAEKGERGDMLGEFGGTWLLLILLPVLGSRLVLILVLKKRVGRVEVFMFGDPGGGTLFSPCRYLVLKLQDCQKKGVD